MSDMRMAKYEIMIEDINSNIEKRSSIIEELSMLCSSIGYIALALIYDYEKCNEYAKVIVNKYTLAVSYTHLTLPTTPYV